MISHILHVQKLLSHSIRYSLSHEMKTSIKHKFQQKKKNSFEQWKTDDINEGNLWRWWLDQRMNTASDHYVYHCALQAR